MTAARTWMAAVVLAMAAAGARPAAAADDVRFEAALDRARVEVGDVFTLTLTVAVPDRSGVEDLDIPEVAGLDRVSRSQSTRMSFAFGGGRQSSEHVVTHTLVLRAREEGTVRIPPAVLHYAGRVYRTAPLTLSVVPPGTLPGRGAAGQQAPDPFDPFGGIDPFAESKPPTAQEEDLLLSVRVDRERAWLGEQVTLVVEVLSRMEIADFPSFRLPGLEGFWVADLDSPTRITPTFKTVKGRRYRSYLLKRQALFPTRSGTLTIPAIEVDVVTAYGLFQTGRTLSRRSEPIEVEVRPLPAKGQPDDFPSTNVGQWTLEARVEPRETLVGQPVTLTVTAEGRGNLDALELPTLPRIPGFKAYDPTRSETPSRAGHRYGGTKTVEWVLVPTRSGTLAVPPLTLHTFDPVAGAYESLSTSPVEIAVVTGGAVASGPNGAEGTPAANVLDAGGLKGIRYAGRIERVEGPPYRSGLFFGLLGLPVVALGVAGGVRRAHRVRRGDPGRRASGEVRRRLKAARRLQARGDTLAVHVEVERALLDYLTTRMSLPARGLHREGLARALEERGVEADLVRRLTGVLEAAEVARYAPAPPGPRAAEALVSQAEALLAGLERGRGGRS